jgi:hypothetical protein
MLQFVTLRLLLCGTLAVIGFAQVGCVPSPPRDPVPPPLPTSSSSTIPGPPATIPGPPQLVPSNTKGVVEVPAEGIAVPPRNAESSQRAEFVQSADSLESWGGTREYWAKQMSSLLESVRDDASATAAAAQLPGCGRQYADAVKQFNATMAAMSLSGQQDQVVKYLQQRAAASPEAELLTKIEAAVNSPQGPILQPAINGLFDAWLQNATSGERRGLERLIEKQKLRR